MRVTYRDQDVKEYWTKRWTSIPVDSIMDNENIYPLKYAIKTIKSPLGKILEAGCGAGRILRYFHARGHDITGIDFVDEVVSKVKMVDSTIKIEVGDITNLAFEEESFEYVLAFGLYHNLEEGLDEALKETYRILRSGGRVCASFRADNIQTRLSDFVSSANRRGRQKSKSRVFHKMNLTLKEFKSLFERSGFFIEETYPVQNMPILYKFKFFRAASHKLFNENKARSEGYQLSSIGQYVQKSLMRWFPNHFCNIYVIIARRP